LDIAIGGGLSPSDVVITAGLTGGGKSAFVLQLSYQIAMHGFPVAFLSGEMTNRENGLRLLSQASRFLNLNSVDRLTSAERAGLLPWADHISQLPIYFDHKTSDVKTLAAQLRALVREKGVKVLVVDYIQLLKVQKVDPKTRHERITEASQEIKRMANELEICVIEVAQFNRVGSKSDRPSMHDLEASGQLEKDASLIFLIDRDAANPQAVTLRIVKGRNSGQGKIEGIFNGANLRFDF
jgi:replicative DNA helicase